MILLVFVCFGIGCVVFFYFVEVIKIMGIVS